VAFSRKVGISLMDTANITIADGDVSNHGRSCVALDSASATGVGNQDVTVSGVRCLYSGCAALRMARSGDHHNLLPGRVTFRDNLIAFPSRWTRTYNPAIFFGGVNNTASRNCMHHGPHNGE
jgi:hypothetical protein